jgi:hypothetical protein
MTSKDELRALNARAQETNQPPAYESSTKVAVQGEPLQEPIYWKGRQWATTAFGIEARDGTYIIAGNRVWENNHGHGWIEHMNEKDWVDLPDFVEALRLARTRWPKSAA